jgi:AraC-like DNA-binding protein
MGKNGTRRTSTYQARLAIFDEEAEIVAREYAARITMADVARRVSVSHRQLQRVFAEHAGMGFRSYLTELRMSKAAELLAASELAVKDVAERVGYRDASQFTKAFKRSHGRSPTQWRASAKAGSKWTHCTQAGSLGAEGRGYAAAR